MYLKGLSGGETSTAIAGLSLTQGNYGAAIEILKKRFESMKVRVPSAWGYTGMLIVERLSESQKENKLLRDLGVFFVCLRRGHKAVCCDSKEKCHCGGRHHPALCENKFRESRGENRVPENARVS